ncbi:hypothetical protein ACLBXO_23640 [Methylobacterium sp. C33D]
MALPETPAPYRLQCMIHRERAGGIIIHDEQVAAPLEEEAVAAAKARFAELRAGRAGSAALRDPAGRVVWSARQDAATPGTAGSASR